MLGVGLAAGVWGLGWAMGVPVARRLAVLAGLWALAVLVHLGLPEGHGLRRLVGGDARVWAVLGGVGVLLMGYGVAVRHLRARAAPGATAPSGAVSASGFRPAELDRYARHILLREIGGPGQARLKAARVLVVGAGGLGSPALLYLAAAGVGTLGVIDEDVVEGSNLQRQIIHADARIGMPKVQSADIALRALNPFITVRPYQRRLEESFAADLFADYDLVLDGTDNFDTRYLVNRVCVETGKPLISAGHNPMGGADFALRSGAGRPVLSMRLPRAPLARHGAHLCRGWGGGALARRDWRDDGDGGGQAHHRCGRGVARAAADPRRALC
jgi:hypothetical protein